MQLHLSNALVAMGLPPGGQQGQQPFWITLFPLLLMVVVFYLVLMRPQQKKAKQHAELLKSLRPGDKVLASGGIVGVVVSVKERSVTIRSADTKLEVLKSAVTEITERSAAPAES